MSTKQDGTSVLGFATATHLSATQRFGLQAEEWVFRQLLEQGYTPTMPLDFSQTACDIICNGLCIEVKTARPTFRPGKLANGKTAWYTRWQWMIHPTHQGEFLAILIAETAKGKYPFIVPGSIIGERTHIQLTSHPENYKGWLAQYLNRWEMVSYLSEQIYQNNGPLFEQWLERV